MKAIGATVENEDVYIALNRLGIKKGGTLLVHSSLSSIGHVNGGPEAVVNTLISHLGANGHLVMPSFTFKWDKIEEKMTAKPFDPHSSKSEMGAITESFRKQIGTLRSIHPTHSWAVRGPKAKDLIPDPENQNSYSTIDWMKFIAMDGHILLLGVHQDKSTIMHFIEKLARPFVPYLRLIYTEGANYKPKPEHKIFRAMETYLRREDAIQYETLGSAVLRYYSAKDLFNIALDVLKNEDPDALLCTDEDCSHCSWARKVNASQNI